MNTIFRARQIGLLLSTARDYQNGQVTLQRLTSVLAGIIAVLDDDAVYDLFADESSILEQIYAQVCIQGEKYDFENEGRPGVDRSVASIIAKCEACLTKLEQVGDDPDDHPPN